MNTIQRIGLVTLVLSLGAIPSVVDSSQLEHAPTIEQCRADGAVWRAEQDNNANRNTLFLPEPGVPEIWNRREELSKCLVVDTSRKDYYQMVMWGLDLEYRQRLEHFLVRHNLESQFAQEDTAGKR